MGLIFKDADSKPIDPKAARIRAILLSLPFAFMGIFALVLLLHYGLHGGLDRRHAMGVLSAAAVCGGGIVLIFGVNLKKQALHTSVSSADNEKPWLRRKDWANGRSVMCARKAVLLLWIFVAFWCAASAVISLVVVPQQLRAGQSHRAFRPDFSLISLVIVFFAGQHDAGLAQMQPKCF